MDANWTRERKKAVDSAAGRPDNRSVGFSLEDLQNYLAYAENEAGAQGYKMNGIRIYLGVYGGNAPNGKADYTTMFIVPTGRKSHSEASMNVLNFMLQGDKDILIDPLNDGGGGIPPGSGYPQ